MAELTEHTMRQLGYLQLLERIAGYVQSAPGRRLVLSLRPQRELGAIRARRGLYEDLLKLSETAQALPGLQVDDLGEVLRRVQPASAALDGPELRQCAMQLETAAAVRAFLASAEAQALPHLTRLAEGLDGCDELRFRLLRSIDTDGSVLDGASERLRELRRSHAETERHLQRTLDAMLRDGAYVGALQEKFVTQRNGRYVLPVKREAQRSLPGLVHDASSTGQTLFVEPAETLPLGNALQTLAGEERAEVRRILAELSAGVRACLESFRANGRILAELDAGAAVARWAGDYQCVLPSFGGFLKLQNARHPLLLAQFREEGAGRKVVPLDLELPPRTRTLAITGSNAGGKTVALKTVGLLALAAQSGLPVPAGPESLFEVYDLILADIGDAQSLADNLSTFSGHVANLAAILKETASATCNRALVLLDELGSGTEPVEGGAIACGVLDALARRPVLALATTHLGVVKNFVHATAGMENAAVSFNAETLEPEFRLELGRPGASHAMMIAKRMGMPDGVLRKAESFLSGEQLRLEEVLVRMDREQRQLARRNEEAEAARKEAVAERDGLRQEREELRRTRKQMLHDAYEQANTLVDNARRELEHLVQQAGRGGNAPGMAAARQELEARRRRVEEGLKATAARPSRPALKAKELAVGRKIWVEKLSAHGRIARIDGNGKGVAVEVGGILFNLKASELFPAQPGAETEEPAPAVTVRAPRFEGQTSHEVMLVGMRVEDALDRLAAYLNDCVLAHLDEVRVVHGFGTGRLREGVQQWLRKQPFVASYRTGVDQQDAGGGGVTIVRLKA